jgi:hypothetical protein
MCSRRETVPVRVKIPADLSCTGKERWKMAKIDRCIAPIVKALQRAGIDMRASCCGHEGGRGSIHLQDGRTILILPILGLAWCSGESRAKKQVPNQWNFPRPPKPRPEGKGVGWVAGPLGIIGGYHGVER